MLEIAAIVLLIAWLLGILSAYTLGGAIHLCLLFAVVCLAIRFTKRRSNDSDRPAW